MKADTKRTSRGILAAITGTSVTTTTTRAITSLPTTRRPINTHPSTASSPEGRAIQIRLIKAATTSQAERWATASENTTRKNGRTKAGTIIIILSHFCPTKRSTETRRPTAKSDMDHQISKSGRARQIPRTTTGTTRMPKASITGGTLILKNRRLTITGPVRVTMHQSGRIETG